MNRPDEIAELLSLSARVGRNPLLVQASSGNTSIKLAGTLWIKASGKWLARAEEEDILIPLDLTEVRRALRHGGEAFYSGRRASIETAMHAVIPHRVVIHTHSVNTIAWAVRNDGAERVGERLDGFHWHWIPYTPSGLPLACAIERALMCFPATDVFVLANHGLVVCGMDCASAERLLFQVENCLAVTPSDAIASRVLDGGVLYPCQAIFLGTPLPTGNITRTQRAVLEGLLQVLRRIPEDAPVRYLSDAEVADLLTADAYGYQQCAELNAAS